MNCRRENEAVRALLRGHLTDEIREHVAGCECCGEALALAAALQADSAAATTPDAGLMWHKMELRRKRELAAAAMRPAIWAERITVVLMAVCAALALPWLTTQPAAILVAAVAGMAVLALSAVSIYWLASPKR
jgi:hypothetical protein